jgi:uncharacterized Zn finger protein
VAVRNRLYPDAGQEPALVRTCDHARLVWNLDAKQQSCWPGCSGRAGVSLPFCAGSFRSIVFAGMSGSWQDWPPSRPIRVEGGIKARSKRGAIGEQWWSRRFIGVLESYGMSGRLARGRSYARAGQVLDFELSQGRVTARVQGSRVRPYQVRIGVLPLTTAQWRRVQQRLAGQALFRAKLLAGEMPHEIEEVFADCGTPLFPRLAGDLDMRCSCPDWEVPCKHLAAVCYVLAEEFDRDPFAMLAWRGQGRDDLLAALRRIQAQGPARGPRTMTLRTRPERHSAAPSGPSSTSRPCRWSSAWTGSGHPG